MLEEHVYLHIIDELGNCLLEYEKCLDKKDRAEIVEKIKLLGWLLNN